MEALFEFLGEQYDKGIGYSDFVFLAIDEA
jgi:hypothetical protein